MSILQPVVDQLFKDRNRVVLDPGRSREPLIVTALALITCMDEPVQLVFCNKFEDPLIFAPEMVIDPNSRDNNLIRTVAHSDHVVRFLRRVDYSHCETTEQLFSTLMTSFYSPEVKLLEFAVAKPVYPTYHGHRDLEEAFDGVTSFLCPSTGVQHPRMLLGLNWQSPEQRRNREEPNPLQFGNALIWAGSGNIHWVTRVKGIAVSLGVAGSAADYNELLRFVRQFQPQGWVANSIIPMPYHLPKVEPKPEPKPQPDNSVFYLNVMQHLANAEPGKIDDAIRGLLMVAAGKHLPPVPERDRSEEYELLAGDTILEYSAGKTPTVIKALNEVKTLITAAFVKKSNEERK